MPYALFPSHDRAMMLKQMYDEEFQRALDQDEERASYRIMPDLRSYTNP